eukprot:146182-Chlamydomonas_euryale.AAC.2
MRLAMAGLAGWELDPIDQITEVTAAPEGIGQPSVLAGSGGGAPGGGGGGSGVASRPGTSTGGRLAGRCHLWNMMWSWSVKVCASCPMQSVRCAHPHTLAALSAHAGCTHPHLHTFVSTCTLSPSGSHTLAPSSASKRTRPCTCPLRRNKAAAAPRLQFCNISVAFSGVDVLQLCNIPVAFTGVAVLQACPPRRHRRCRCVCPSQPLPRGQAAHAQRPAKATPRPLPGKLTQQHHHARACGAAATGRISRTFPGHTCLHKFAATHGGTERHPTWWNRTPPHMSVQNAATHGGTERRHTCRYRTPPHMVEQNAATCRGTGLSTQTHTQSTNIKQAQLAPERP